MLLYHGTNKRKPIFTSNSCFTRNLATSKEYAYYWTEMYGGHPYTIVVDAKAIYVGGPDEYKLTSKPKIVRIIKHP